MCLHNKIARTLHFNDRKTTIWNVSPFSRTNYSHQLNPLIQFHVGSVHRFQTSFSMHPIAWLGTYQAQAWTDALCFDVYILASTDIELKWTTVSIKLDWHAENIVIKCIDSLVFPVPSGQPAKQHVVDVTNADRTWRRAEERKRERKKRITLAFTLRIFARHPERKVRTGRSRSNQLACTVCARSRKWTIDMLNSSEVFLVSRTD